MNQKIVFVELMIQKAGNMTDTNVRPGIPEFNCPVLVVVPRFFMVNQLMTSGIVVFKMIVGNNGMGKYKKPCKKQD
ncbi:MAG: hypothetical protein WCE64_08120 [Bacteroidales bacterium]